MGNTDASHLHLELLQIWHQHRMEVLCSAAILFTALRLALYWRWRRLSQRDVKAAFVAIAQGKESQPLLDHQRSKLYDSEPTSAQQRPKNAPKRVIGVKRDKSATSPGNDAFDHIQPFIFYFSLGGSTKSLADDLSRACSALSSADEQGKVLSPLIYDLTLIELDDYFVTPPTQPTGTASFYFFLIPSYDISTELDIFLEHLRETHHDFRIDTAPLSGLVGYSVFGLGDQHEWPSEQEGFCKDAIAVDKWMAKLTGGRRAYPLGVADTRLDVTRRLEDWQKGTSNALQDLLAGRGLGDGVLGSGEAVESADEADEADSMVKPDPARRKRSDRPKGLKRSQTTDLEDLKAPVPVDFTTSTPDTAKPMVPITSPTYTSLTKQGYTIVGSHSGVKICRWTKSALRGRGSCYKFSFYGIQSHLCMEATPSLSCSNKCVFCWRHGTNPVGTTWRWTVDPPDLVFTGMKDGHYKKIKMMKGVPGVRAERFQEAMHIRHCALSLVGEPIFYPHINELVALLHAERISTFLVCNAQHPDQLEALHHVTQLYVSIDASNKDTLRKIDRPLHRDYWERFLRCMDILRAKRFMQRTVFRLTLVKGFNIDDEAEGYADLVARALPAFVEVKGVTYCGTSTAVGAGLSMQNVPFYAEVSEFVLALESALQRRGLEYGIAAEHAHSCCILLADKTRFYRSCGDDGVKRWHTLINYAAFFRCLEGGKEFGPDDYIGNPTPEWALWGNGGFDPRDQRVDRKGRLKEVDRTGETRGEAVEIL